MTNDSSFDKCVCHMPEAWSIEYIKSQWLILEKSADIHFFQSWHWMDAWLGVAKKHVRPIIFKHDSQVIGITFIGTGTTIDYRFLKFPTFILWGTGITEIDMCASEYNRPITLRGYESIVKKSLIHFLLTDSRCQHIKRIDLRRIPQEDYKDYEVLGYHYYIYKTEPVIENKLSLITQESPLLDHISKSGSAQIRKSIALYHENFGEIVCEVAENATKAQNWFVELGKLHQRRFQAKNKKGAWDYPALIQMQRALLDRCFDKNCVQVVRVRAGEKVIGYLYNFMFKERVYFYMSGLVYEEDNKYKPGLVTHFYAMQYYASLGYETYDFLAGEQAYKRKLGHEQGAMLHVTITRDCALQKISMQISHLKKIFQKIYHPAVKEKTDL